MDARRNDGRTTRTRAGIGLGMMMLAVGLAVVSVQACGSSNSSSAPDSGVAPGADSSVDSGTPSSDSGAGGDSSTCIVCGGGDGGGMGTQSPIPTTCSDSIARNSYIGCDYWPTVTLNPVWPQFDFAVAVSNPQSTAVMVSVAGGALTQTLMVSVPAGSVKAITLPWVPELKGPTFDQNTVVGDPGPSRIVAGGAYHLFTTAPVSVYQFSALEYEIDAGTLSPDGGTCPGEGDGGAGPHCFSYSNDASLLLPTNVAGTDYGILAWPSFAATPGFMAVVATKANTHVTVYASGRVQGVPGSGPQFLVRGDNYTYTLQNAGDVLEMFSDTGDLYNPVYTQDISGSIVEADNPIVTYGGHGCTYIPQDKKACDHLESSMFPIQSLGEQYIVTMPHTPHGEGEWVRIMAFYPNTKIAFDPPANSSKPGDTDLPTAASPSRTTSSASSTRCRRTRACPIPTWAIPASAPPSPSRSTDRRTRSSRRCRTRRTGSTSWRPWEPRSRSTTSPSLRPTSTRWAASPSASRTSSC